jgi:hypothetical protein
MLPGIAVAAGLPGVVQEDVGKRVAYYHVEAPNYLRDDLVVEGLIVESFGAKYIEAHGIDAKKIYTKSAKGNWYERMSSVSSKVYSK